MKRAYDTPKRPPEPGFRLRLDIEVWCPWSGVKVDGQTIHPHKLPVNVCRNGTFFAHCSLHDTRVFCREFALISKVGYSHVPVPVEIKTQVRRKVK
jgi:hypothetical protein